MAPVSFTSPVASHDVVAGGDTGDDAGDGLCGERRLRDEIVDLAAQVDELTAALHKRLADSVGGCSLRELSTLARSVHRARSVLDTTVAGVVAECDRGGWVGMDGHRCVRSWVPHPEAPSSLIPHYRAE